MLKLQINLELIQLSLPFDFFDIQQFMTSTIIGATTMDQLKACIHSIDIEITKEILNEIKKIHEQFPHPAP